MHRTTSRGRHFHYHNGDAPSVQVEHLSVFFGDNPALDDVSFTLERAERENWDDARLAATLDRDGQEIPSLRGLYRRAVSIVDAPTPAESFRRGVRFSIQDALEEGLDDEEGLERLVGQICHRAADLGYLLEVSGEPLAVYSEELRDQEGLSPYSPLSGEQAEG